MAGCAVCGVDIPTVAETPLCSTDCKQDWLQTVFNEMSDDDAFCPICGRSHNSVKDALYHYNNKHSGEFHRTETCEQCGEEFIPSSSTNFNKFCSEECFGFWQREQ